MSAPPKEADKVQGKRLLVFIDAGHGGIDEKGHYTTAPSKMWKHKDFVFYEGVYNRNIANKLAEKLKKAGIDYEFLHDEVKDIALTFRVRKANELSKNRECVLFSIHGNAADNLSANYFSVWTSRGNTKSDAIAEILYQELQKELPEERFSADTTDNDRDWEANFTIIDKTICPAILSENGFFTNEEQARKMLTPEWQDKVANAHFNTILKLL